MKRVYNTLVILFGLLTVGALNSCSLDEQVYTQVDKGEYVKDAQQAESVLLGVYDGLGVDGVYGHNLSMIFDMPNDQAKPDGTTTVGNRLQASNAYSTTDAEVQETWAALYAGVYNAIRLLCVYLYLRIMGGYKEQGSALFQFFQNRHRNPHALQRVRTGTQLVHQHQTLVVHPFQDIQYIRNMG